MKKIISYLGIISCLCVCIVGFAGCNKNDDLVINVSLNTENYTNWLSPNLYITDLQVTPSTIGNVTYDLSCVLHIKTVKTQNCQFENVTIKYAAPNIKGWNARATHNIVRVDYDGSSHTSFTLISTDRIIIDFPQPEIFYADISEITGTVVTYH